MERAEPLRIEFKPSRSLVCILGIAHALALLSAWVSLSGWPQVLVLIGVLLSAAGCLVVALLVAPSAAHALELHPDGRASWRDRTGLWHEGRLGGQRFAVPALVVLGLEQAQRGCHWIVLMPDSVNDNEFRRLRVWLRWRRELAEDPPKP
jgi:toxin CptA